MVSTHIPNLAKRAAGPILLVCTVLWSLYVYIWTFYPPIGVYIAILGGLAVVMSLWPPELRWSKAARISVFVGFTLLEITNLFRDQDIREKNQTRRDFERHKRVLEERKAFEEIASKIGDSLKASQQHFEATIKRSYKIFQNQTESLRAITGGTDYCYLDIISNGLSYLQVKHDGKYTVFDVEARIVNLRRPDNTNSIQELVGNQTKLVIGNLGPHTTKLIANPLEIDAMGGADYNIFFNSSRNGFWTENLSIRRFNDKWPRSVDVFRNNEDGKLVQMMHVADKDLSQRG